MAINFFNTTRLLINTETGFRLYAQFWANENFIPLLDFIVVCINIKRPATLLIACLSFLRTLFVMEQLQNRDFITFIELFDTISMKKTENNFEEYIIIESDDENQDPNANTKNIVNINTNRKKKRKGDKKYLYGSEILTAKLIRIFNELCKKDRTENGMVTILPERRSCYELLQVLLNCSEKARVVARNMQFTQIILERLENINKGLGMTCKDFIRRYGDEKV